MAAPAGPVVEDFNRANTGPPPGGTAWSNIKINAAGTNQIKVVSNRGVGAAGGAQGVLAAAVGPDWDFYSDIAVLPGSGQYLFLAGVYSDLSTSTWDGYGLIAIQGANWTWQLRRYDNGVSTQLTPNVTSGFNVSAGDAVGMSRYGSTLEAWHRKSGVWSMVMTRTSSTYTAVSNTVRLGVETGDTAVAMDNIGFQTIAATSAGPVFPRRSSAGLYMRKVR